MKNESIDMVTLEFCPVGSVVLLHNSLLKVMIIGTIVLDVSIRGIVYDYMGIIYPKGIINNKEILYFNQEDISRVLFLGQIDKRIKGAFLKYKKVHIK